jgi:hypothetical protein
MRTLGRRATATSVALRAGAFSATMRARTVAGSPACGASRSCPFSCSGPVLQLWLQAVSAGVLPQASLVQGLEAHVSAFQVDEDGTPTPTNTATVMPSTGSASKVDGAGVAWRATQAGGLGGTSGPSHPRSRRSRYPSWVRQYGRTGRTRRHGCSRRQAASDHVPIVREALVPPAGWLNRGKRFAVGWLARGTRHLGFKAARAGFRFKVSRRHYWTHVGPWRGR